MCVKEDMRVGVSHAFTYDERNSQSHELAKNCIPKLEKHDFGLYIIKNMI